MLRFLFLVSLLFFPLSCLGDPRYGEVCSTLPGAEPCDPEQELECLAGQCGCPGLRKFHGFPSVGPPGYKCVGLPEVEGACDPGSNTTNLCMEGTSCGPDGKCHCNEGRPVFTHGLSFPNKPMECMLEFGDDCSNSRLRCNTDQGLSCTRGKCDCLFSPTHEYDQEKKICASGEGLPCRIDLQPEYPMPCATGLECEAVSIGNNFGRCVRSKNR